MWLATSGHGINGVQNKKMRNDYYSKWKFLPLVVTSVSDITLGITGVCQSSENALSDHTAESKPEPYSKLVSRPCRRKRKPAQLRWSRPKKTGTSRQSQNKNPVSGTWQLLEAGTSKINTLSTKTSTSPLENTNLRATLERASLGSSGNQCSTLSKPHEKIFYESPTNELCGKNNDATTSRKVLIKGNGPSGFPTELKSASFESSGKELVHSYETCTDENKKKTLNNKSINPSESLRTDKSLNRSNRSLGSLNEQLSSRKAVKQGNCGKGAREKHSRLATVKDALWRKQKNNLTISQMKSKKVLQRYLNFQRVIKNSTNTSFKVGPKLFVFRRRPRLENVLEEKIENFAYDNKNLSCKQPLISVLTGNGGKKTATNDVTTQRTIGKHYASPNLIDSFPDSSYRIEPPATCSSNLQPISTSNLIIEKKNRFKQIQNGGNDGISYEKKVKVMPAFDSKLFSICVPYSVANKSNIVSENIMKVAAEKPVIYSGKNMEKSSTNAMNCIKVKGSSTDKSNPGSSLSFPSTLKKTIFAKKKQDICSESCIRNNSDVDKESPANDQLSMNNNPAKKKEKTPWWKINLDTLPLEDSEDGSPLTPIFPEDQTEDLCNFIRGHL